MLINPAAPILQMANQIQEWGRDESHSNSQFLLFFLKGVAAEVLGEPANSTVVLEGVASSCWGISTLFLSATSCSNFSTLSRTSPIANHEKQTHTHTHTSTLLLAQNQMIVHQKAAATPYNYTRTHIHAVQD